MQAQGMKHTVNMVVLGSLVTPKRKSVAVTVTHRLQAAWRAWAGIRPQAITRGAPLAARLQLIEAVVLPSFLCGRGSEGLLAAP